MDWFGFGAPKENAGVKTYSRAASKKKQKPSSLFTGLGSVHALADHPENVPYSKRKEQVCSPTKKEMKKLRSRRENPDSPRYDMLHVCTTYSQLLYDVLTRNPQLLYITFRIPERKRR